MSKENLNEINTEFVKTYDEYSQKYNLLANKIDEANINCALLEEVISLKSRLTKIKIIMKIDDLLKI